MNKLINNSFTFVTCSDCQRTIKIEVGKDIRGIKCECEDVKPVVAEAPAPKKRTTQRKLTDES